MTTDQQRMLTGTLTNSYDFKHDGLVKKSITVKFDGRGIHLISYYNLQHVLSGELLQPCQYPDLANTVIIDGLTRSPTFRIPLDSVGNELPAIANRQARTPEIVAPLDPEARQSNTHEIAIPVGLHAPVNPASESIPATGREELRYGPMLDMFFNEDDLWMIENDLYFQWG
jgi:hypothetical protein